MPKHHLFAILIFISIVPKVDACTCSLNLALRKKPERQQIKIAAKEAKAVFEGKVVSINRSEKEGGAVISTDEVHFRVRNLWKGVAKEELIVYTAATCCVCGYVFHVGETYLVYATGDGGTNRLGANICTRTRPASEAVLDLKVLGPGKVFSGTDH